MSDLSPNLFIQKFANHSTDFADASLNIRRFYLLLKSSSTRNSSINAERYTGDTIYDKTRNEAL